jgi:catechol 2,3-dioxygenase
MAEPMHGLQPPGFRLPPEAHVGAVRLQVTDLQQSLDYYQRIIGLRALRIDGNEATLGAHGDDRALVHLETRPGLKPARRGAIGLYHFAILLPDRQALGHFAAHLAALRVRAGMADHLVSEAFYLWDPDGLGIEVYADRPPQEWRYKGRELVMTTDPLNVDSVIEAGAGGRWDRVPAGTTIGHVHLHVGDLDRGEAFYHRALGFDKTVWTYPGALFMAAGSYHHHLGINVWGDGPAAQPDEARLLEWELIVPSGADGEGAIPRVAADPWGNRVHLRSNRD